MAVRRLILALLLALLPMPAAAAALPPPTGPVILTVSGRIAHTNGAGGAAFDRAMLERLGLASLTTSTPWTEGVPTFTGVPLGALLSAVGAAGATLEVIALNDYKAEVPAADAAKGALLALDMNGAPMRIRDKGPAWLVYPLDQDRSLRSNETKAKMVWQITRIVVR